MEKTGYEFSMRVSAIHKLRVNLKSLVGESRHIRFEERRACHWYRDSLRGHRIRNVREEIRYTGLALAWIRKRPYAAVETANSRGIDIVRLCKKVSGKGSFGTTDKLTMEIAAWIRGQ